MALWEAEGEASMFVDLDALLAPTTGLCALTQPCVALPGSGMPVGFSFHCRGGDEMKALSLGLALETLIEANNSHLQSS